MSHSPVFQSQTNHPLKIFFAGEQTKRCATDWPASMEDIISITGEYRRNAMLTVLASTDTDEGHGTLRILTPQSAVHADGAHYHSDEPASFMFQTGDCPFLVVQDDETGKVVMGHCGKYAMRSCASGRSGCGTMVDTVLSHFKESEPNRLSAYVTAGICGHCYTHELDVSKVASFYKRVDFGENRERGELDLIRRIKHQLRFYGIPEINLEIDYRCTKETLGLSSYRNGHEHRNTIVVQVS